jgi:hypothetical protein
MLKAVFKLRNLNIKEKLKCDFWNIIKEVITLMHNGI